MSQKALVIVPTYNERENLPPLVERIFSLPVEIELLIVDDNSPDGTGKLADELAAKNPRLHVLHRAEKNGLGRAYCAGFAWALERGYEFIMEMDGDFSHNPADIPAFLKAAETADLVIGSRYSNGIRVINWPLKRLMLSLSAAKYVRVVTGLPISDPTGGYKCFSPARPGSGGFKRRPFQRLQFSDRTHAQNLAAGPDHRGSADCLHRPVHGEVENVRAHRVGSHLDGVAAVVAERGAAFAEEESGQGAGLEKGQKLDWHGNDGSYLPFYEQFLGPDYRTLCPLATRRVAGN